MLQVTPKIHQIVVQRAVQRMSYLFFPDDRPNVSEFREVVEQSIVSALPISAILSVASQESFNTVSSVLLISTLFPDHSLIPRGPPALQC